jgi:hypothetical protein
MSESSLGQLEKIKVNRSNLRQNQRAVLKKAKGRTIVIVTSPNEDEERCVVDKKYFEEILTKFRAAIETLEITTDTKLFNQILRTAETIDEDLRLGRLHSLQEAFEEK